MKLKDIIKQKQDKIRKTTPEHRFVITPWQVYEISICLDGCCGIQIEYNNTDEDIKTDRNWYKQWGYVQEIISTIDNLENSMRCIWGISQSYKETLRNTFN